MGPPFERECAAARDEFELAVDATAVQMAAETQALDTEMGALQVLLR